MSARGDLLNALAKARKLADREIAPGPVELDAPGRNTEKTSPSAERDLDGQALWDRVCVVVPDPVEQRVVALMLDGTRETLAYSAVLRISDRPLPEQAREVKRVKDKLRARLQRAGWAGLLDDPARERS